MHCQTVRAIKHKWYEVYIPKEKLVSIFSDWGIHSSRKSPQHKAMAANEINASGNLSAYLNSRRDNLRRARKGRNMAEKCRTGLGYQACKSGVTPGDYFHHVELPYIYRHDSELDAHIDLQRPQNETDINQKRSTELSTASNNVPFVEKIEIWYIIKWIL